ncbi:MAG TPA: glycosyltransferase [Gammaproteobacteria bacterium]|jgi:glycosyltransferase involved in cell wall biosynthesis
MSESSTRPRYSIVIPVGARVDELDTLIAEYDEAFASTGKAYEIIAVLDGRRDESLQILRELSRSNERLRVIELAKTFGESAALAAGFDAARADLLVTLPAYYQVTPSELPKLLEQAGPDDDMLIAVRWPRTGGSFDKLRRGAFHALFEFTSGMTFRDLGCGVRLFKREIASEIPLYGDQHRFLPALASRRGFRVRELDLHQSPKDVFRGRYRLREYLHRFLDVLTVFFLVRFTKKPLRFFGTIGFLAASVGGLFTAVLVVQRLFFDVALADRPALLLGSLLIVLGVQTFALGLIGELIIFTHATQMKEYAIRSVIEGPAAKESASALSEEPAEQMSAHDGPRNVTQLP